MFLANDFLIRHAGRSNWFVGLVRRSGAGIPSAAIGCTWIPLGPTARVSL